MVKWLDVKWNGIWPLAAALGADCDKAGKTDSLSGAASGTCKEFCSRYWFVHFAGGVDWDKVPKIWSQLLGNSNN
jgi:hypothetical protein